MFWDKSIKRYTNLICLSAALLSGCSVIPGSHIEGLQYQEPNDNSEQALQNVKVQVINSQLIASQKASKAQTKTQPKTTTDLELSNYEYRLGVGDVLAIGVWDHPELTIPAAVQRSAEFDGFRIQADGTITYAYVPKLPAAGKTINELHADLVKALSKIIEKPQVDIKVVGFNSQKTYITGEVKKPGIYPITEIPLTLIDAISKAGGITQEADWREVSLTRQGKTEVIKLNEFYANGDTSQNRLLKHGDVVHVTRTDKQKVYVLGDVNEVGVVPVHRYGLSLAEALTQSGGLNEQSANANGIFVLRKRQNNNTDDVVADVFQLHAKNAVAMLWANEFELQSQDIVYVTTAPIARWNRLISQILPTITAIDYITEVDQTIQAAR
ncbi:polysaccharide biosynthesis protein [Saccharobesus litoralis]|uniref:Polysaccharide biosynthesis protein n=1 Tax=Saccharobesus litoralis TaxID=2172099 RepID=A0A2S0VRA1_9ALTE|nr:polysaccharide export protein [Saccharobesus litoralis]AWB66747.1 polysaccharide biosynthesis protein [Saccharobesus litoralis]